MSNLPGAIFMDAKNGHLWALIEVLEDALRHRADSQIQKVSKWVDEHLENARTEIELLEKISHLTQLLIDNAWHESHLEPGEEVEEGHFDETQEMFLKQIRKLENKVFEEGFGP